MNITLKAGLASAVAVAACFVLPTGATAADLNGRYGSMKDSGYQPMPHVSGPALAGPCYLRGDIGYSWNNSPSANYVGMFGSNKDLSDIGNGMFYFNSTTRTRDLTDGMSNTIATGRQ